MSKRNAEALNRLANYIAHHPERYDQTQWGWKTDPTADKTASVSVRECGSNQCLAGHAARQSGWTPYVTPIASGGIFVDWEKVRKPGQHLIYLPYDVTIIEVPRFPCKVPGFALV